MKILPVLLIMVAAQLLAQSSVSPAPVAPNANLPAQRIQPNDLIGVEVYDSPELTRPARVDKDGTIGLPLLKHRIKVEGLMPIDAEGVIAAALAQENIIVNPVVTVTVAEYHKTLPISVVGAVKTPLTFETIGPTTLLDAISRAGGLSSEAGSDILISNPENGVSGDPTVLLRRVSVKDLIDKPIPEANVTLVGGEQIRIPEAGSVFVIGNVKRPGVFPVRDGTRSTTVLRIIAVSEGLLPNTKSEAIIYRREPGNASKNQIPIDLAKIVDGKAPDVPLEADDILYIPENHARRETLAALQALLTLGGGVVGAAAYAELAH